VLDLEYGLPVQVRDSTLEEHERQKMPQSDVTRGYMIEQVERNGGTVEGMPEYGKAIEPSKLLERLQRRTPYYKRNLPHLCSFFAKGECNRGATCPYRHEMPLTGELANQNIKDRYFGNNDPVAAKMMRKSTHDPVPLVVPEDKSITTLWVGGVVPGVQEDDIRARFSSFGTLSSVRMVPQKSCAFVTYMQRGACEEAANNLHNKLVINGNHLRLSWGKKLTEKKSTPDSSLPGSSSALSSSTPGFGSMPPPGSGGFTGLSSILYPSQSVHNLSTRLPQ